MFTLSTSCCVMMFKSSGGWGRKEFVKWLLDTRAMSRQASSDVSGMSNRYLLLIMNPPPAEDERI